MAVVPARRDLARHDRRSSCIGSNRLVTSRRSFRRGTHHRFSLSPNCYATIPGDRLMHDREIPRLSTTEYDLEEAHEEAHSKPGKPQAPELARTGTCIRRRHPQRCRQRTRQGCRQGLEDRHAQRHQRFVARTTADAAAWMLIAESRLIVLRALVLCGGPRRARSWRAGRPRSARSAPPAAGAVTTASRGRARVARERQVGPTRHGCVRAPRAGASHDRSRDRDPDRARGVLRPLRSSCAASAAVHRRTPGRPPPSDVTLSIAAATSATAK